MTKKVDAAAMEAELTGELSRLKQRISELERRCESADVTGSASVAVAQLSADLTELSAARQLVPVVERKLSVAHAAAQMERQEQNDALVVQLWPEERKRTQAVYNLVDDLFLALCALRDTQQAIGELGGMPKGRVPTWLFQWIQGAVEWWRVAGGWWHGESVN